MKEYGFILLKTHNKRFKSLIKVFLKKSKKLQYFRSKNKT
jgi:hypothetical protein